MKYIQYNSRSFRETKYYRQLPEEEQEVFNILTSMFHFKVNNYVLEELINWDNVPNDPIYRLMFLRKSMLLDEDYTCLKHLMNMGEELKGFGPLVENIKKRMFPHREPCKNRTVKHGNRLLYGVVSDFETIVSIFPKYTVKTCHAYCTYCFRWPILNNAEMQRWSSYDDPQTPVGYLREHPEVKDVLLTGADPLATNAKILRRYLEPILEIDSISTIRISSKSLSFWPYRFTTDKDADDILRLFEDIQAKGKHLSFLAHVTHVRELETDAVKEAVKRIQSTGAIIRCQGPIVEGINDTAQDWSNLWTRQLKLGIIPYYMFIEGNHHPTNCFRVPLAKTLKIFQEAQKLTSGTARTVRGPVFVYEKNRVLLDGITTINNKKYFVLKSLQSPPEAGAEGKIELVPYDESTTDLGDLFTLFKPKIANDTMISV